MRALIAAALAASLTACAGRADFSEATDAELELALVMASSEIANGIGFDAQLWTLRGMSIDYPDCVRRTVNERRAGH